MSSSRSDPGPALVLDRPFADNAAHVRAELAWVHALLRSLIRQNAEGGDETPVDEFAGLYISREEVERYLADEPLDTDGAIGVEVAASEPPRGDVWRRRGALDRRVHASRSAGAHLRFDRIARAFELDLASRVAFCCVVAGELDAQVSRVFAYLQNDATRKRPSLALLTRLVTGRRSEPLALRRLFSPSAPLVAGRLIEMSGDSAGTPLPARDATPAVGLVDYVLGIDALPAALAQAAELVIAPRSLGGLAYHRHHVAILDELRRCHQSAGTLSFTYLSGPSGSGRRLIAEALAGSFQRPLLCVDWPRLRVAASALDDIAALIIREARVRDCLVLLEGIDEAAVEGESDRARTANLLGLVQALGAVDVLATGTASPADLRHRLRMRLRACEVPYPTAGERVEMWSRALSPGLARQVNGDVPALAEKFRFTPGQIAHALRVAEIAAPRGPDDEPLVTTHDLHARCREEAQRGLHLYCEQIVPRFEWDDIVLPTDLFVQLREICQWVRHGSQVYEDWGFGGKRAVRSGVSVLFSGPSGTGKTMSAEVIASDLQLDLFRVDLSRVVSKYIGETEKNLARIFEQSAVSSCVLFFDEADALFGKRTEVKDAHDRYANIEVNYLLSQMDRYQGLIIVATNLKGNLDPAFIRRFSHVVEYPVPNERLRETIWRKSFPPDTPLADNLDFAFLAQRLDLSGANIRNIALTSAFLASADSSDVDMDHVIRATRREYQKIGRICSKSDFGQYYGLVREADAS